MYRKRKAGLRSALQDLQQKDFDSVYEYAMAGEKRDMRAVSELSWRGALGGEWLVKTVLMLACRSSRLPFILFRSSGIVLKSVGLRLRRNGFVPATWTLGGVAKRVAFKRCDLSKCHDEKDE
ncbi:hypothetical protein FPOAC2_03326 [Fusarium poae]|jgi:hypothetical protein